MSMSVLLSHILYLTGDISTTQQSLPNRKKTWLLHSRPRSEWYSAIEKILSGMSWAQQLFHNNPMRLLPWIVLWWFWKYDCSEYSSHLQVPIPPNVNPRCLVPTGPSNHVLCDTNSQWIYRGHYIASGFLWVGFVADQCVLLLWGWKPQWLEMQRPIWTAHPSYDLKIQSLQSQQAWPR